MKKRIVALLIVLCLVCGMIPAVSAAEVLASGTCGENLTWVLTEDWTLTISGTGEMDDYYSFSDNEGPWRDYDYKITSVVIENGVTTIGDGAFRDFVELQSVSLPGTLTRIGYYAFDRCKKLPSINLPNGLKEICRDAFSGCDSITSITIPSKIEAIEDYVFSGCDNLTTVVLPDGLKSIGYGAFWDSALSEINIPSSVTHVDGQAFAWTPWEEKLDGGYIIVGDHVLLGYYDEDHPLYGTAIIPKGVKYIAPSAFGFDEKEEIYYGDCWGLTGVVFPDSLLEIGYWAFNYQELETVHIPANVRLIEEGAFGECYNLKSVYFEGDAPVMEEYLFGFGDTPVTAYYPKNNPTWTDDVLVDYDGDITWVGYHTFDDVSSKNYYFDPVVWASTEGITSGTSDTKFSPYDSCLRSQVVTFLWRAAGEPKAESKVNPFVDVKPGDYYYDAVLWAVESGITTGADATHFEPNGVCNRSQVVTFLYRAFEKPPVDSEANPFTDVSAGDWYASAVLWAVQEGITNGLSEIKFGPNEVCNRSQVVTFLHRAYVN